MQRWCEREKSKGQRLAQAREKRLGRSIGSALVKEWLFGGGVPFCDLVRNLSAKL